MSGGTNIILRQPIREGVTLALDLKPGDIFNQKSRKFSAKKVKKKTRSIPQKKTETEL